MRKIIFTFCMSIGFLLTSHVGQAASPPWYYDLNLVNATIGADKTIKVKDLEFPDNLESISPENPVIIPIEVCDAEKAALLAVFLKPTISDVTKTQIRCMGAINSQPVNWSTTELKDNFERTFKDNPYFVKVGRSYFGMSPIFKAEVIQFFCDNIAVASSFCHFVAADAFARVLKDKVSGFELYFDTAVKQ